MISIARRSAGFAILGFVALLTACSSGVKLDDVNSGAAGSGGSGAGTFGSQPWNDPKSPLFERSVYFGFDEFTVDGRYQKMLSAHASFLKQNTTQKIIIQGIGIEKIYPLAEEHFRVSFTAVEFCDHADVGRFHC